MLKNPEDRRVRRSRRLLKESLLDLMQEKQFSEMVLIIGGKTKQEEVISDNKLVII